ncbi:hypothetical protein Hypma_008219 [Hypsizygus marmoreus]|uniref:Uncharacterized protein n=1 Tax=Hypsizygus marmoreus TaxID=39966 RepID=A0A369JQR1_HYPMA|nr:hypothetical protein Hypma_008219 [Hypsizygus marmoreus]
MVPGLVKTKFIKICWARHLWMTGEQLEQSSLDFLGMLICNLHNHPHPLHPPLLSPSSLILTVLTHPHYQWILSPPSLSLRTSPSPPTRRLEDLETPRTALSLEITRATTRHCIALLISIRIRIDSTHQHLSYRRLLKEYGREGRTMQTPYLSTSTSS